MRTYWIVVCLLNFAVAAAMGVLLRFSLLAPLGLNYEFLLHAHSHTAILGWIYMALFCAIVSVFLPDEKRRNKTYDLLFWLSQLAVVGMMVSFPMQGYALFSIFFSSLHLLLIYAFVWRVWRDLPHGTSPALLLLKPALGFLVFSTLGLWVLAPIMAFGQKGAWYESSIQFFLYFQFNGWFIFAALALFVKRFEWRWLSQGQKRLRTGVVLLSIGTLLGVALPFMWFFRDQFFLYFSSMGVLLQFAGTVWLVRSWTTSGHTKISISKTEKALLVCLLVCFALKSAFQLGVLWEPLGLAVHWIRAIAIGVIHLVGLGIINAAVLAFLIRRGHLPKREGWTKLGSQLFLLGFILTELLLFAQGYLQFFRQESIESFASIAFVAAFCMLLGILLWVYSALRKAVATPILTTKKLSDDTLE